MPLARHLTPDSNKNTQVPRTVNTHTELTGGPAYPDCRPPPGRSVTDSQSLTAALVTAGQVLLPLYSSAHCRGVSVLSYVLITCTRNQGLDPVTRVAGFRYKAGNRK